MHEAPNLAPEPGANDFDSDYQLTIPAHLRADLEAKAKEARLPFDDFAIQCQERYKRSGAGRDALRSPRRARQLKYMRQRRSGGVPANTPATLASRAT